MSVERILSLFMELDEVESKAVVAQLLTEVVVDRDLVVMMHDMMDSDDFEELFVQMEDMHDVSPD